MGVRERIVLPIAVLTTLSGSPVEASGARVRPAPGHELRSWDEVDERGPLELSIEVVEPGPVSLVNGLRADLLPSDGRVVSTKVLRAG